MSQVRTVIWKEIRQFAREPRLIAFLLFSPVAMTLLFGYALSLQVRNAPLAVFDEDRTYLSQSAKDALWRREEFVVSEADSMEEVRRRLASGEARIGLHIPADFSAKLFAGRTPTLRFFADGSMPTVAVAMKSYAAKTLGAEFQRALRVEPPDAARRAPPKDLVRIETSHLYNPPLEDRAFFLPGIAGILVLEVAVVLASSAIVREKERRTMEQLLVAPIERAPLILGKLAPYGAVAFLDFCVISLVVRGVFEVPFAGSPALLAALTTLYIAANLAIGLHISTLARTEQQAVFFCLFVMIPS
ncbi:MAG: ABC transporter permease, partial [Candidatus Methylomirabilis sp.]|nr:ABC transporter permease [Deltaproteobacteria bacterium]